VLGFSSAGFAGSAGFFVGLSAGFSSVAVARATVICEFRFLIGCTRPLDAGTCLLNVVPSFITTSFITRLSLFCLRLFSAFAAADSITLAINGAAFLFVNFRMSRASVTFLFRTRYATKFAFFGEILMFFAIAFIVFIYLVQESALPFLDCYLASLPPWPLNFLVGENSPSL
jgi:hypothetical protein